MRPLLASAAAAAAAALSAAPGCFSSAPLPETHHYTLSVRAGHAGDEPVPRARKSAASLLVEDLAVRGDYRGEAIAYRDDPYAIGYYAYHRWARPPAQMLADELADFVQATGVVRRVSRDARDPQTELTLRGRVSALEELDRDGAWLAHLALRLEVRATDGGTVVVARDYDRLVPAAKRNPRAVVEALSGALRDVASDFALALEEALGGGAGGR